MVSKAASCNNQLAVADPTFFPDRSPIDLMLENHVLLGLSIAIMTVSAKQWASLDMFMSSVVIFDGR